MDVYREERKNRDWKSGNPYLDRTLPDGPLMTLENDPNVPFIGQTHSFEEEEDEAAILALPCPRELLRDTHWEDVFPLPMQSTPEPPYRPSTFDE